MRRWWSLPLLIVPFGAQGQGESVDRLLLDDNEVFFSQIFQDRAKGSKKETASPTFSPTRRMTSAPTLELVDRVPVTIDNSVDANEPVKPDDPNSDQPTDPGTPVESTPPTSAPQQSQFILCDFPGAMDLFSDLASSLTSDESFQDLNSYHCRALRRVLEQQGYENFGFETFMKYWVLYCIYFATNRPTSDSVLLERQQLTETTWENTSGWRENNLDPCDGWHGVTCDLNGLVTDIRLQRNGLSGTFPQEIVYLTIVGPRATGAGDLRRLEISNNEFLTNDNLPWISQLGANLKVLNYASTNFKGPIPELPPGIEEFDCSNTFHNGPMPELMFEGLDRLRLVIMDGNNFDSSIPTTIATLSSLAFLYIREAGLKGDLTYMKGMPSIVEHSVDGNPDLAGPIYSFIGQLQTLKSFSATDCGLVSPFYRH